MFFPPLLRPSGSSGNGGSRRPFLLELGNGLTAIDHRQQTQTVTLLQLGLKTGVDTIDQHDAEQMVRQGKGFDDVRNSGVSGHLTQGFSKPHMAKRPEQAESNAHKSPLGGLGWLNANSHEGSINR